MGQDPNRGLEGLCRKLLQDLLVNALQNGIGESFNNQALKPSNILVNSEGTVKLADFRVATFFSDQDLVTESSLELPFGPRPEVPYQYSKLCWVLRGLG